MLTNIENDITVAINKFYTLPKDFGAIVARYLYAKRSPLFYRILTSNNIYHTTLCFELPKYDNPVLKNLKDIIYIFVALSYKRYVHLSVFNQHILLLTHIKNIIHIEIRQAIIDYYNSLEDKWIKTN